MEIPTASGLIKLQPHTSMQPGAPYFVTDRAITPAGVTVQQYLRRTRTPGGSTLVWTARRSEPSRSEIPVSPPELPFAEPSPGSMKMSVCACAATVTDPLPPVGKAENQNPHIERTLISPPGSGADAAVADLVTGMTDSHAEATCSLGDFSSCAKVCPRLSYRGTRSLC
jgi:hypothetical protein